MIPIENIFYIYCYAWGRFPEGAAVSVGSDGSPNIQSLLASVLLRAVSNIERRGIDRDYVEVAHELKTVRGRIQISETMTARLRDRVAIVCQFDELSVDVPHNQVLKATIRSLIATSSVDSALRRRLMAAGKRLARVSDIKLSAAAFRQVRLSRMNAYYDLAVRICRLVYDRLIPFPDGQGYRFVDPLSDETHMARVFESFVRNFSKLRMVGYTAGALEMPWFARTLSGENSPPLPLLRMDTFLKGPEREVIIDAKYYREAMTSHRGKTAVRSAHLFQMFAYLKNSVAVGRARETVEGLLLYPSNGLELQACYEIHGHKLHVCTVNLNQEWSGIERDLIHTLSAAAPEA